jgi:hypothetical protein
VAQKSQHKGALFGHISNGGGTIDMGNGYSLKFIALDDKFVTLEMFHHAINATPRQQSWQKAKVIIEKPLIKPKTEMKIEAKVERTSAW